MVDENFSRSLDHFEQLGARLYRAPLRIEGDLITCQVRGLEGIASGYAVLRRAVAIRKLADFTIFYGILRCFFAISG